MLLSRTALHMAIHGKHERTVLLLLDQYYDDDEMTDLNIDPTIESYEEKRTALDLALEEFGLNHPITNAFFDSSFRPFGMRVWGSISEHKLNHEYY